MKYLLALTLLGVIVVGCSSTPSTNGTTSNAGTREIATYTASSANVVIGVVTESPVSEEATSELKPMAITVRPPMAPVLTSVALEGWQTFTSAVLGVAVDYPGDWTAIDQADGATFTSPQGAKIQFQVIKINDNSTVSENKNQQCATLINAYGLSIDTCIDTSTTTYSAQFSLQSKTGLIQQLLLSTTSKDAMDVYKQMLDSLRPSQ